MRQPTLTLAHRPPLFAPQASQRVVAFVLVFALGMAACSGESTADSSGNGDATGRGAEAPLFDGEVLSGGVVSLESLRGTPVVVNFWTTTCGPCVREMPALAATARDHEGLTVIGVNYGEQQDRVQAFIDDFEIEIGYPIVLDKDGAIGRRYGVAVLPMTYFIDADGIVQYRRIGELEDRHIAEGLSRIT